MRPTYTVADCLEKFGWVPRRGRDQVNRAALLNARVIARVAEAGTDRAAHRRELARLAPGRHPRARREGGDVPETLRAADPAGPGVEAPLALVVAAGELARLPQWLSLFRLPLKASRKPSSPLVPKRAST